MGRNALRFAGVALLLTLPSLVWADTVPQITVHTSDFIGDATRSSFNGFESIPNDGIFYTGDSALYVEDGIAVSQVHGVGPVDGRIWVTCSPGICFDPSHDGNYSWYPKSGDYGYTRITRVDGVDFWGVGFLVGSGYGPSPMWTHYDLRNDGVSVLSGSVYKERGNATTYLGFSGGGFDELRLYDRRADQSGSTGNSQAVDSIELTYDGNPGVVPIPAAYLLFLSGLGLLGMIARRRAAAS